MKNIDWETIGKVIIVVVVLVLGMIVWWARWHACDGDLACFILAPKWVIISK